MMNLLYVLRYHSDRTNDKETDWIQDFAIVCSKHGCADKTKDFFSVKMLYSKLNETLPSVDNLISAVVVGDGDIFPQISDKTVRMPRVQFGLSSHSDSSSSEHGR